MKKSSKKYLGPVELKDLARKVKAVYAAKPPTDPQSGVKHDSGKPPMSLLPHYALVEVAKVMGMGVTKYGRHNWKGGMDWSRVIDAAHRHLGAFQEGEDLDPESGLSHLAHLMCCAMFLLEYKRLNLGKDDR